MLFDYRAVVCIPPFDVICAGFKVSDRDCGVFDFGRLILFDYYIGPGGLGIEEP